MLVLVCSKQLVSHSGVNDEILRIYGVVCFSSWFLSLVLLVFVAPYWHAAANFAVFYYIWYRDGRTTAAVYRVFLYGFSYVVTTGWIFEISLCENSIPKTVLHSNDRFSTPLKCVRNHTMTRRKLQLVL